jgi:hypothetical protein
MCDDMFLLPCGDVLFELLALDLSKADRGPVFANELGLNIILTYFSSSSVNPFGGGFLAAYLTY